MLIAPVVSDGSMKTFDVCDSSPDSSITPFVLYVVDLYGHCKVEVNAKVNLPHSEISDTHPSHHMLPASTLHLTLSSVQTT
jgi:hypothetical protein